ncbi:M4 family metallopeptidase [Ktedonospora formicarum]|uniref:Neutral metalloproteinase n=1 Tax=Ktedonospora formicarum TaxID=2778364 RepID=A0A8J3I8E5_9CHLR|nr:M4 family metallopeptidase [Ktedonospora formicarum]GHO47932.1 metalloprotease [Ktedonospora formicarum]
MQQHIPRHSRYGIVPPYILYSIANRGTRTQRQHALRALQVALSTHPTRQAAGRRRSIQRTQSPTPRRTIYDAHHSGRLPGKIVRKEGQAIGSDSATNEAYDGLGWSYRLYQQKFGRNSIDNQGQTLKATVHYSSDYNNAFWDERSKRVVFGDGDGDLFRRFTVAIEVIGHELTHGITAYEADLDYKGQSGALNESISDVFGSLIKQFSRGQTADQADWLIGEGLFTHKVQGVALRSLKAPGTAYNDPILGQDPQPATMDGYIEIEDDDGGVHTNSGIPNHAFYLVATALGGYAWEKAGHIWYKAMTDSAMGPQTTFKDFANLTLKQAERLQGDEGKEREAVQQAWEAVKVLPHKHTSNEESAAD